MQMQGGGHVQAPGGDLQRTQPSLRTMLSAGQNSGAAQGWHPQQLGLLPDQGSLQGAGRAGACLYVWDKDLNVYVCLCTVLENPWPLWSKHVWHMHSLACQHHLAWTTSTVWKIIVYVHLVHDSETPVVKWKIVEDWHPSRTCTRHYWLCQPELFQITCMH